MKPNTYNTISPVTFLTEENNNCFLVFKYMNIKTKQDTVNMISTQYSTIEEISKTYEINISKSIEKAEPIPKYPIITSEDYSSIIYSSAFFMNHTAYKYAHGAPLNESTIDTMIQMTNSLFPTNVKAYVNTTNITPMGKKICRNVKTLDTNYIYKVLLVDDTKQNKNAVVVGVCLRQNKLLLMAVDPMTIKGLNIQYNNLILCRPEDVRIYGKSKLEAPKNTREKNDR